MTIEGTVVDVMETWPLQLSIRTTSGLFHVVMSGNAVITSEGREPVDASALRPGAAVEVRGELLGPQRMTVELIDLRHRA